MSLPGASVWAAAVLLFAPVLRPQHPPARVFTDRTVLDLRLEAPLATLFAARRNDAFHVSGTLSYNGADGNPVVLREVQVSVRGHTSRRDDECTFPKLKLKLPDSSAQADSVFAGLESVKVGTHCGDAPGGRLTRRFGRLANERSPLREASVYALLDAFGVAAPRARLARFTYVDTIAPAGSPLVRYAVILEDDDDLIARLGARAEIPAERFSTAQERFAPADTARIALAEAMIGNFDWCLRFTPDDRYRCDATNPLWNVMALERADGHAFPVIKDFDLAGMVTGVHPWFATVYPDKFGVATSRIAVEVLSQAQRTRSLFDREVLDAARRSFLIRRRPALEWLASTTLDDDGRAFAQQYLEAFFAAIESDATFYGRVVASPGGRVYVDADRTNEACRSGDAIPPGTPVVELGRTGGLARVQVLDVLWHWAPPAGCPAVRQGAVWIDADTISADYPRGRSSRD